MSDRLTEAQAKCDKAIAELHEAIRVREAAVAAVPEIRARAFEAQAELDAAKDEAAREAAQAEG